MTNATGPYREMINFYVVISMIIEMDLSFPWLPPLLGKSQRPPQVPQGPMWSACHLPTFTSSYSPPGSLCSSHMGLPIVHQTLEQSCLRTFALAVSSGGNALPPGTHMAPPSFPFSLYLKVTSSTSLSSPPHLKCSPYSYRFPLLSFIFPISTDDQVICMFGFYFIECILSAGSMRAGIFVWFVC